MTLDWKNIDWSALFASKVVLGAFVTIITGALATFGHSLPAGQQSQLTDGLSKILEGVSTLAGVWTLFHRVTAQAETATTIVPKKDATQTPKGN